MAYTTTKISISPTMRSYLAHVYWLSDQQTTTDYVSSQNIADTMLITLSAVNRTVIQLRHDKLIDHQRYKGVRLTPEGVVEALVFLRHYSIIKSFLVAVMGFGWHEVHHEAIRITLGDLNEHVIQRMYGLSNSPTHDPHGYPIASEPGLMVPLRGRVLSDVMEGQGYTIERVATFAPDRLQYIAALNLMPGVSFWVTKVMPFQGPVQVQLGREYRIIGRELAQCLRVAPTQAR